MNVKTVSVNYGRKVNLGDYNSANVECTIWADVTEEDDLNQSMKALWNMAKENVKAQILPLTSKNGNGSINVKETFLGLELAPEPVEVKP